MPAIHIKGKAPGMHSAVWSLKGIPKGPIISFHEHVWSLLFPHHMICILCKHVKAT